MKKQVRLYKHPHAFDVVIEFGTFTEMMQNRYDTGDTGDRGWEFNVEPGGNINRRISDICGRRASFFAAGVHIAINRLVGKNELTDADVKDAYGIGISHWGGVWWNYDYGINDELKSGLFPVKIDWYGKIYTVANYVNHEYIYKETHDGLSF